MRIIALLVILTVLFLLLRMFKGGGGGVRLCPHCSQQIPAVGMYCPICGKRVV